MAVNAFDRFQRDKPALGLPIAVVYKFVEDQGLYLAAIIAFYGMFSLFPLMLLLSSLLGFALESRPDLQEQIIAAALQLVPLLDETFVRRQLSGSGVSLVIGAVGALLGALGLGTAVQNAMNMVWSVPRHLRPNPVLVRVRSLALLFVLLVFVLLSTALSQLGPFLAQFDPGELEFAWVPMANSGLGVVASFVVTTLTFAMITRLAVRTPLTFLERLPGALLGALLWQLLQSAGTAYVRVYVARATIADSVFSSLLGVLMWIFLAGVILVLALEFNVVLVDYLYPRSLLAIFTDNESLTSADKRVYERKAKAVRFKSFERIDVTFTERDDTDTVRMQIRRLRGRSGDGAARPGAGGPEPGGHGPGDQKAGGSTDADVTRTTAGRRPVRGPGGGRDAAGHTGDGSERRAHDEAAT